MSGEAESPPGDELYVEAKYDGNEAAIILVGEFDMHGTSRFWAFMSEALAGDPRSITVDASSLEFVDSAGLMTLVRAREAAIEAGVSFRVSEPSPALRRIAELCGLEDLLSPE